MKSLQEEFKLVVLAHMQDNTVDLDSGIRYDLGVDAFPELRHFNV